MELLSGSFSFLEVQLLQEKLHSTSICESYSLNHHSLSELELKLARTVSICYQPLLPCLDTAFIYQLTALRKVLCFVASAQNHIKAASC